MKTGYKEMLRDRCPQTVDFALKWCNAKTRWVEHAYSKFIRIVGSETKQVENKIAMFRTEKENKKAIARIILGIVDGKTTKFNFDSTIDWDDLTDEEANYWYDISKEVEWFTKNFAYVENTCEVSLSKGCEDIECKVDIITHHLSERLPDAKLLMKDRDAYDKQMQEVDRFADYLLKCVKQSLGRL